MKVAILWAGSRGTALAQVLANNGHEVKIWAIDAQVYESINFHHQNPSYLPEIDLNSQISCSLDIQESLVDSELIVIAVPSRALMSCLQTLRSHYQGQTIVLATKGRNKEKFWPLSQVVREILTDAKIVVLSGASHAEEVVRDLPTGVVLASEDLSLVGQVKFVFHNEYFKCSLSQDILGVQLLGACKNIVALACGLSDGLGYGVNAKALLLTEWMKEILLLGKNFNIHLDSAFSYAGVGDMYVTCSSNLSRNWNAGRLLAQGYSKKEITGWLMKMVAEGLFILEAVEQYLNETQQNFPLMEMLIAVINKEGDAKELFDRFIKQIR